MEAAQNQELWERSHTKPEENPCKLFKSKMEIRCSILLRFGFVLSELWKPNKTRSCGKEATQNLHADCSKVRMKSYVLFCFGSVLSELWKPNKTRSCEKEAAQNQDRIHANCSKVRIKSTVRFTLDLLSKLWKPNKTRSYGKEAIQNQENPCKLLLHKR